MASMDSFAHIQNVFRQRLLLETAKIQGYSWSYVAFLIASSVSLLVPVAVPLQIGAHA